MIEWLILNNTDARACQYLGQRGLRDAREMARLSAVARGAGEDQALVLSTGVIGEFLPMEKIARGIQAATASLGSDEKALISAARGLMTTDTVHKLAGRTVSLGGVEVLIAGMAKGAAMIGPNMATMLGVVLTDATLRPQTAQATLKSAVDTSFNCISVDGHMSTNDSVLLLANGAAGATPLVGDDLTAFGKALEEVCVELARSIPADGEGATHFVTIEVVGCLTRENARTIAKTIANSPLVKTAVAGADPNWGRIVSAAGYSGVSLDPAGVSLRVNGFLLYRSGVPVNFDARAVSDSIRDNRDTLIQLELTDGNAAAGFWTTDLTAEYVRLNADYHT